MCLRDLEQEMTMENAVERLFGGAFVLCAVTAGGKQTVVVTYAVWVAFTCTSDTVRRRRKM